MHEEIKPLDNVLLAQAERMGMWPPLLADNDPDAFEHEAPLPEKATP